MISTLWEGAARTRDERCSRVGCAWALAMSVILHAWSIDLATAQSTAPKAYRITAGDKIGVTVFGQPDLSGESTVDQSGNIRLPMIGDIYAVNLTLTELERSIAHALAPGYVRNPTVSIRIAEFSPIYVLGMVRTPGLYPYREGLSVLGAIARAGGIGASEIQQSGMLGALLQADERVRLLEISRVALLAKRARLIALQNGDDRIDFPDMSETRCRSSPHRPDPRWRRTCVHGRDGKPSCRRPRLCRSSFRDWRPRLLHSSARRNSSCNSVASITNWLRTTSSWPRPDLRASQRTLR